MPRRVPKAVPVVVGAGLAVGTFCGLLFGVGLRKPAEAAPVVIDAAVEIDAGADAPPPIDASAIRRALVRFQVEPADADATITVDGEAVDHGSVSVDVTDGERTLKVKVKADGYRTLEQTVVVSGDQEVALPLKKRETSSSPRPPRGPERPTTPGNLIDL